MAILQGAQRAHGTGCQRFNLKLHLHRLPSKRDVGRLLMNLADIDDLERWIVRLLFGYFKTIPISGCLGVMMPGMVPGAPPGVMMPGMVPGMAQPGIMPGAMPGMLPGAMPGMMPGMAPPAYPGMVPPAYR